MTIKQGTSKGYELSHQASFANVENTWKRNCRIRLVHVDGVNWFVQSHQFERVNIRTHKPHTQPRKIRVIWP